jgi:hypothetical protein
MPEVQPANDPGTSFAVLPRTTKRWLLAGAVLRALLTTTILLTAYILMPFTLISQARYLTAFLIGAAVVLPVLAAEFSRTMRSPYPRLRAVEALLTAGPLFIVLFATSHHVIGQLDPTGYFRADDAARRPLLHRHDLCDRRLRRHLAALADRSPGRAGADGVRTHPGRRDRQAAVRDRPGE